MAKGGNRYYRQGGSLLPGDARRFDDGYDAVHLRPPKTKPEKEPMFLCLKCLTDREGPLCEECNWLCTPYRQ